MHAEKHFHKVFAHFLQSTVSCEDAEVIWRGSDIVKQSLAVVDLCLEFFSF